MSEFRSCPRSGECGGSNFTMILNDTLSDSPPVELESGQSRSGTGRTLTDRVGLRALLIFNPRRSLW